MRSGWRRFARRKLAVIGLGFVLLVCLVALFAPVIAPYGANEQTTSLLAGPSGAHLLGTDNLGRDVFSRLVWGSRMSLAFGIVVAGVSLLVGTVVGALAGYFGRWIDDVLSRIVETFMMIPSLFLLIVVGALIGRNVVLIMIVAGLTLWPSNARLARAQVLSLKHELYVDAARLAGTGNARILFGHVMPNGLYPVVANSTLQVGSAVILEASLSFLGVGNANVASWGSVLKSGQPYLTTGPWICLAAGIVISLLVLAFNLCGDGLNDMLSGKGQAPRGGTA